jgi:hypothetical protein
MDTPHGILARIAVGQHGIFAKEHARQAGFSEGQIKRNVATGLWEPVHQLAFRVAAVPVSWRGALLAACWAGGFRAVASHRSAAALWNLAGGRRSVAEITCPRWRRAQHDRLVVHETKASDPADLTFIDAIPVTTPERTLLDLGAVCHPSVVEMAVNRAEHEGLVSGASLRRTLARLGRQGRNGAGVLRALVVAHYGRPAVPESEMETMLLQLLRRNGFPQPVLQYEVRHEGRFVARVDAAYPDLRIAIEYDSTKHHSAKEKQMRDNERRNRIWAAEWFPITATYLDMKGGGGGFCAALRSARRLAA